MRSRVIIVYTSVTIQARSRSYSLRSSGGSPENLIFLTPENKRGKPTKQKKSQLSRAKNEIAVAPSINESSMFKPQHKGSIDSIDSNNKIQNPEINPLKSKKKYGSQIPKYLFGEFSDFQGMDSKDSSMLQSERIEVLCCC